MQYECIRVVFSWFVATVGLSQSTVDSAFQDPGRFRDMSEKGYDMQLRYLNYPKISSYSG